MTLLLRPLLLSPENFTPRSRTPWGGTRLAEGLKRDAANVPPTTVVGESWELSVEPSFPSRLADGSGTLDDHLALDLAAGVGERAAREVAGCPLLVKIIDAELDLSVQIHPDDDYARLGDDECGKPEAWYVFDHRPGAGLYLGLAEGVTEAKMREALDRDLDVSRLLAFVPVEVGDFFVLPPGTAHAIGGGVTLVEPQRVLPARRGVTYRYWDWARRYDASGKLDQGGEPRSLQVREALEVTDFRGPREETLLRAIRTRAGRPSLDAPAAIEPLATASGPVQFEPLEVERVSGTGSVIVPARDRLRGLTVLEGSVRISSVGGDLAVACGFTVALPAALGAFELTLDRAHAILSSAAP